jgi:hypothetical protein
MGSRTRTATGAASAELAPSDEMDPSSLTTRVEILTATCRRHEAALETLLETVVKLHGANSALRAENASLRRSNAISMIKRVRPNPRARPGSLLDMGRTAS